MSSGHSAIHQVYWRGTFSSLRKQKNKISHGQRRHESSFRKKTKTIHTSRSKGVPAFTKFVTSAMWTSDSCLAFLQCASYMNHMHLLRKSKSRAPTRKLPFSSFSQERASSTSSQPAHLKWILHHLPLVSLAWRVDWKDAKVAKVCSLLLFHELLGDFEVALGQAFHHLLQRTAPKSNWKQQPQGKLDTDGDTSLKGWSLTSYSILSSWSSWRMKGLGAEWIHSMSFFFTRKVAWKKDTPYISLTILQVQIGRSCDPCQGSE